MFLSAITLFSCASITTDPTKIASEIVLDNPTNSDLNNQLDDDVNIANKLQRAVDAQFKGQAVKVVVNDYNVLLVGQVTTTAIRSQVNRMMVSSANVRQVYNYLTVTKKPKLTIDNWLTKKAQARFNLQNNIDTSRITLVTVDNVLYAMVSNVGDLTSFNRAVNGANDIVGIAKVVKLVSPRAIDYSSIPPLVDY